MRKGVVGKKGWTVVIALCLLEVILVLVFTGGCGAATTVVEVEPARNPDDLGCGPVTSAAGLAADEAAIAISVGVGPHTIFPQLDQVRLALSPAALAAVKRIQCPSGWTVESGGRALVDLAAPPAGGTVRHAGIVWRVPAGGAVGRIAWVALVVARAELLAVLRREFDAAHAGAAPGCAPPFRPSLDADFGVAGGAGGAPRARVLFSIPLDVPAPPYRAE